MKKQLTKTLLLTTVILLTSISSSLFAQKQDGMTIEMPPFNGINVSGSIKVTLTQGDVHKIEISGIEKQNIISSVEDNVLKIRTKNKNINNSEPKVIITYQNLDNIKVGGAVLLSNSSKISAGMFKIIASGASSVHLDLLVNKLTQKTSGASKVELSGIADELDLGVSGASMVDAVNLKVNNATVNISGASKVKLDVIESVSGTMSGVSTITFKNEPQQNTISKNGSSVQINKSDTTRFTIGKTIILMINDNNNTLFNDSTKKEDKFKGHWGGLRIGINGYMDKDNDIHPPAPFEYLDLSMNKSVCFEANLLAKNIPLYKNNFGIVTGLGLQYNNYRFDNNKYVLNEDLPIISADTNLLANYTKNKLVVNYLTIPFLFEYQTKNKKDKDGFHIAAGGTFGLRIGSHLKLVDEADDKNNKAKIHNDFHLSPFKYGISGIIGYGDVSLFANLALSELFENNEGPVLYPYTVGIRLVGW